MFSCADLGDFKKRSEDVGRGFDPRSIVVVVVNQTCEVVPDFVVVAFVVAGRGLRHLR